MCPSSSLLNSTASGPNLGKWTADGGGGAGADEITGGLSSGPIALFNQNGTALVASSHSSFMASGTDSSFAVDGSPLVAFGTMGSLEAIPAGFRISHCLFAGTEGINKAFRSWGDHMLSYYGKPPHRARDDDVTNQYLGFTTDNGKKRNEDHSAFLGFLYSPFCFLFFCKGLTTIIMRKAARI